MEGTEDMSMNSMERQNPGRFLSGGIFASFGLIVSFLIIVTSSASGVDKSPVEAVFRQYPCTIDGLSSDWDWLKKSNKITHDDGSVAATFKLSYDHEHFYALIQVNDDSPLKNSATVPEELLKGGDAVGLCFGSTIAKGINQRFLITRLNAKPYVLAMRPRWPRKRPYTYYTRATGAVTMDNVGEESEVDVALKLVPNGYVVELAIPWKVLGTKPADDLCVPFDLQVIYSDPAGSINQSTVWWHSRGSGPSATMDITTEAQFYPELWGTFVLRPAQMTERERSDKLLYGQPAASSDEGENIEFVLPQEATVSLIIVDEHNWVVRELLRAKRLSAGHHTVQWNGRDRWGHPMPPGKYRYRLGYFDRVKTSFYGSVGNSGRPVYRTKDGLGSIGGTHGGPVAVAADNDGVYMLHSVEEGQKCLRKIGVDGKAKWFASTGVFGTGKAVASDGSHAYMIYQGINKPSVLSRYNAKTGQPAKIGTKVAPFELPKGALRGLAVVNDKAYFGWLTKNKLLVLNLSTGDYEDDIPVPSPVALCAGNNSDVYVCGEDRLFRVDTVTGSVFMVVDGLTAPSAVTIDRVGNLYVSELGSSQQIRKFSPEGVPLAKFGTAGGRPSAVSHYDPMQFRNISGLAVGPDDNLWVVEKNNAPRRFIRMTLSGQWVEDFYGPTGYGVVGIDLDDPSTIYYQAIQSGTEYVQAKVDYSAYARDPGNPKGAWCVEAIHNFTQNGLDDSADPDLMSQTSATGYKRALAFTADNGKRYLWMPGGDWTGIWLWENKIWKPVAAVRTRVPEDKTAYRVWTDRNADGLVQPEETSRDAPAMQCVWIGRDLTLHTVRGKISPTSIDARGVPCYEGAMHDRDITMKIAPIFEQANYATFGAPRAKDGTRYLLGNIGPDRGLSFWDRAMETRLVKFKNGKPEWIVGHHDGRFLENGDNVMLMNLAGEVDGVILASEVQSNFTAYTTDGLTLGWVCGQDNNGKWQDFGPTAIYVENVQPGIFIKDPETGKRLLFAISTEDVRVLEIDGVFGDQITRHEGVVTLRSARHHVPKVKTESLQPGQWSIPYSTWAVTSGNRFIGVDGYPWEWSNKLPVMAFYDNGVLVADLRLRRDAGMLCVFADVLDATPFDSNAKKGESLSGVEGIELFLGPVEPVSRTQSVPGDTAVLLTARWKDDELVGIAKARRPASQPLAPSPYLRPLSPWGTFHGEQPKKSIDFRSDFAEIPGSVVKVRPWLDGRGYSLEAEIPLFLFSELSNKTSVRIKRQMNVNQNSQRPDLVEPFRFNARIRIREKSNRLAYLSWMSLPPGSNPDVMYPAYWGVANLPEDMRTVQPAMKGGAK
jgi:hypothetical protein